MAQTMKAFVMKRVVHVAIMEKAIPDPGSNNTRSRRQRHSSVCQTPPTPCQKKSGRGPICKCQLAAEQVGLFHHAVSRL